MRNAIRVALTLGALVLVGCGGRPLAEGKEAAAGALFQASRGALNVPGGALAQVMNSGALGEVKINCSRGGNVAIRINLQSDEQQQLGFDLAYDGCSFDGRTSMRGTLHVSLEVVSTETSVSMGMHLQGRVEFWGEISDFIDVNVTETVAQSDLTSPTFSVSLTLNGTISTSSGTYTFENEALVIDGSTFLKAPDPAEG